MPPIDKGQLYLGGVVDADGERTGPLLHLPADDLTTHGVLVGMTGSGKTGLGVVLLEEALLSGVPVLAIDPKGDLGNLLLNFPALRPEDFAPWVDPAQADREGLSVPALGARTAKAWADGLASWDVGSDRMRRLGLAADYALYTPGSSTGIPLNLIGSLAAPAASFDDQAEALRDEIETFVTSLLTLAGEDADPLASPAHVLLANLIEKAWREGRDLDLPRLVGEVLDPPLRKLGVFELDAFFPAKDRQKLARRLNGMLASPTFASRTAGSPLDAGRLFFTEDGQPRASILSIAHLSDEERQFVVALVLSRVVTWLRRQPGTGELRALIYMDEVFGFVPPSAAPPAKKPILTILKQARAHGVGMVLSTQNPVDLDYKAMSNAGTWMVGRLQTERDKARILDALDSAAGGVDRARYDALIGGLGKRRFLLHSTRSSTPTTFATRWAMSFLRGPLTGEEIRRLTEDAPERSGGPRRRRASSSAPPPADHDAAREVADDESPVPPTIAEGVRVRHLDPAAPWAEMVGGHPGGRRLEAALVARVALRFDDRKSKLDHAEVWEAVFHPLGDAFDPAAGLSVDWDPRDLRKSPPPGSHPDPVYALPRAPLSDAGFFRDAQRALRDHLHGHRTVEVLHNPSLGLFGRVGEDADAFAARCTDAADARADEDAEKLRRKLAKKIDRQRDRIDAAARRVRELEADVGSRRTGEIVAGAGALLSMFLGGRASTRGLSGIVSRRGTTSRTAERLRSASEKHADEETELAELEDELADELERIQARWDEAAGDRTTRTVGLEKSDIDVDDLEVVWIPRRVRS